MASEFSWQLCGHHEHGGANISEGQKLIPLQEGRKLRLVQIHWTHLEGKVCTEWRLLGRMSDKLV